MGQNSSPPHSGSLTLRRPGFAGYVATQRARKAAAASVVRERQLQVVRAATMAEVFTAYVGDLRARGRASAQDVQSAITCWLEPALGQLAPADCKAPCVVELVRVMETAGLAANTIRTKASFVRSALVFAVRAGLIDRSPIDSLRGLLPRKRPRPGFSARREVLSIVQVERLAASLRVPPRERAMYLLAALTGLRGGELYELRGTDIERTAPDLPALVVSRQWSRKRHAVGPTKTGAVRVIPLRLDVLAVLDRWLESGWPALTGRAFEPSDLLFPQVVRRNLCPLNDRRVLKRFHRHLRALGLEHRRLHAFRHTFVSLLLDAGVPKDVVEQCTHPSPAARPIDVYAHYSWRVLCEAVLRVRLELRGPSEQLELFAGEAYHSKRRP